ncbi:MAG: NAD(P)/FAD-dependent oxidoreductase [Luteimonas sp.]
MTPVPGPNSCSSSGAPETTDCLIVGAGPAGLVAATYLARFRRRVTVVDAGGSRAAWIPTSHNCPGFPSGVSGKTLLQRLRDQAGTYGVTAIPGRIETLERAGDGFIARDAQGRRWRAACVILATGIIDRLPDVEGGEAVRKHAIDAGVLRLCAVCDGYEASDERIGVLGPASDARRHADFLGTFSRKVEAIATESALAVHCSDTGCAVSFVDGSRREYDTLYPVLGSDVQSQLARALGADVDEEGALRTDAHLQTSIAGLYAIGDVVSALNQIAVAVGHAAIAATAIHNQLPPNPRGREEAGAETWAAERP